MDGVKLQKTRISCKTYTNVDMKNSMIAMHLLWQRIEELGQVFLPQKYTFRNMCHFLEWRGQPLPDDVQIIQEKFGST